MNLTELIKWNIYVILGWAIVHHIDDIHRSILKAQAKLIYESRTETWGRAKIVKKGKLEKEVFRNLTKLNMNPSFFAIAP